MLEFKAVVASLDPNFDKQWVEFNYRDELVGYRHDSIFANDLVHAANLFSVKYPKATLVKVQAVAYEG